MYSLVAMYYMLLCRLCMYTLTVMSCTYASLSPHFFLTWCKGWKWIRIHALAKSYNFHKRKFVGNTKGNLALFYSISYKFPNQKFQLSPSDSPEDINNVTVIIVLKPEDRSSYCRHSKVMLAIIIFLRAIIFIEDSNTSLRNSIEAILFLCILLGCHKFMKPYACMHWCRLCTMATTYQDIPKNSNCSPVATFYSKTKVDDTRQCHEQYSVYSLLRTLPHIYMHDPFTYTYMSKLVFILWLSHVQRDRLVTTYTCMRRW